MNYFGVADPVICRGLFAIKSRVTSKMPFPLSSEFFDESVPIRTYLIGTVRSMNVDIDLEQASSVNQT